MRRFGFGTRMLAGLPGRDRPASSGRKLSDSALASVSMGYQVGVTPLQMATAVSSVANGGDADAAAPRARGHPRRRPPSGGARRRCAGRSSADTAAELTDDHGRRRRARHRQARADRRLHDRGQDRHRREADQRRLLEAASTSSSFVGFVPSRKPVITVLVMIDSPQRGPVLRRPGGRADLQAHRARSPSGTSAFRASINPEPPVVMRPRRSRRARARPVTFVSPSSAGGNGGQDGVMPDLRGLSARDAVRTLARLGLVAAPEGQRVRRRAAARGRRAARHRVARGAAARASAAATASRRGRRAAMTLSVLLGALVGPGLLNAAPYIPAPAGDAPVSEVAYDSRRATSGSVFVALRGPEGRRHAVRARRPSRAAPWPSSPKRRTAGGFDVPWVVVPDARLALARARRSRCRAPERRAAGRRHHRHQRQDDDGYLLRSIFEAAGIKCGLLGTVVYSIGDRGSRGHAHDAGSARRAADAARRCSTTAAGPRVMEVSSHALSLQARRRHRVRGRRLHEPDARPPRLPRRHGGVLRGQAAAVRDAAGRGARRRQPRRSAGRRRSSSAHRHAGHLRGQRGRQTSRRSRSSCRCTGLHVHGADAARPVHIASRLVGRPNVYNILAAVATARGARPADRRDRARPRTTCRACPAASRSSRRPTTTSPSSSTTRTPTMR